MVLQFFYKVHHTNFLLDVGSFVTQYVIIIGNFVLAVSQPQFANSDLHRKCY